MSLFYFIHANLEHWIFCHVRILMTKEVYLTNNNTYNNFSVFYFQIPMPTLCPIVAIFQPTYLP